MDQAWSNMVHYFVAVDKCVLEKINRINKKSEQVLNKLKYREKKV